jgi:hypothetical protein
VIPRPRPPLLVCLAALCLAPLCLTACAPSPGPRLLEVDAITPARSAPGDSLEVTGRGFRPGAKATVTLEGESHVPGRDPAPVRVTLAGHAVTEQTIALDPPASLAAALAQNGTFTGRAEVILHGTEPGARISGSIAAVKLTVEGEPSDDRAALRAASTHAFDQVGLAVEADVNPDGGLVITDVAAASFAASAGLMRGDLLREANGHLLREVEDAAPPPGARSLELVVVDPETERPRAVSIPLSDAVGTRAAGPFAAFDLSMGLCLLFAALALFGPGARAMDDLAERLFPVSSTTRATHRAGGHRAWLWHASAVVGAASVAMLHSTALPQRLGTLLFAIILTHPALLRVVRPRERGGDLLGAMRELASEMLPFGATSIVVLLTAGSLGLGRVVDAQGPSPLAWGFFREPALLVLGVLCLVAAGPRSSVLAEPKAPTPTRSVAVGAVIHHTLACTMIAVVFFGGWASGHSASAGALGIALLAGKTFAVSLLRRGDSRATSSLLRAGVALGVLALAAAAEARAVAWAPWMPSALLAITVGAALIAALRRAPRGVAELTAHEAPAVPSGP